MTVRVLLSSLLTTAMVKPKNFGRTLWWQAGILQFNQEVSSI